MLLLYRGKGKEIVRYQKYRPEFLLLFFDHFLYVKDQKELISADRGIFMLR
jgi:hypothetical protein